jgi:hypothetical protein
VVIIYVPTNIGGPDGVHILARQDSVEEGGGLNLLFAVQGHLDHDSMNILCLVQIVDGLEELLLGDAGREVHVLCVNPDFLQINTVLISTTHFVLVLSCLSYYYNLH